jgi:hypothetical protein
VLREPISFFGTRILQGQVSDFRDLMDPQGWERNVPFIWGSSRVVDDAGPLPDRRVAPATVRLTTPWKDRLLFEVVSLPMISTHRNLLQTSVSVAPDRIEFRYSQYECLTSVFLGRTCDGGIDVDEGRATCEKLDDQRVKLTISKKVRFTQPTDELDLVSAVGEVAVKMLLELLLLGVRSGSSEGVDPTSAKPRRVTKKKSGSRP